MSLENIPNSSVVLESIKEKQKQDVTIRIQKNIEREKILEQVRNEYIKFLLDTCCDAIKEMTENGRFSAILPIDFDKIIIVNTSKYKFHSIHYGFVDEFWNQRIPFNKNKESPFKEVQKQLYEKGYYLLDNSNPSRSFRTVITLFASKPKNYDLTTVLWHGLNKI